MHPDPAFRMADEAAMRAFAHLFCQTADGPMVAEDGALHFHIARGNRITRHLDGATALASIAGPDAYISPDWYGGEGQVPTWNYVAVEAEGTARLLDRDGLPAAHEAMLAPKPVWRGTEKPGQDKSVAQALRLAGHADMADRMERP